MLQVHATVLCAVSNATSSSRSPLDRSAWLDAGLDALHDEGIQGVKVERLARCLGVTKGSFYHHFSGRRELLMGMIDRWRSTQEGYLRWLDDVGEAEPRQRLHRLLEFILGKDGRHDVGMRAWARTDEPATRAVEAVDRGRIDYVEQILRSVGFEGDEARLRARMIYLYQIGEQTWSVRDPEELRQRLYRLHTELLEREPPVVS